MLVKLAKEAHFRFINIQAAVIQAAFRRILYQMRFKMYLAERRSRNAWRRTSAGNCSTSGARTATGCASLPKGGA